MLTIDNLEAGYGASRVLFGLSLEAPAGQVVSLIGRNGMGKSTTVRTIMGMMRPRAGHIRFDGRDLAGLAPNVIARLGIGLVPEGRRVFASLSVEENLVATARPGRDGAWTLARVLKLFPRLDERRRQLAKTLSGGEQQMLAIGRALLINPRLLILDEATEGLAPLIRAEIWRCLQQLKTEGQTILLIDKNLAEMASLVDRHYVVEKGHVVWAGSPAELQGDPQIAQRYLGL
ncbi:ABC transporter ATP-binding protein [Bradyrhizobium sp. U87765 SZCCT0131]|uniref:ABC transporter ATP-binding protein n=1 Tax=unclassified Bradyrhizobium TaxID=2631580 RepID=UPI001BAE1E31|nr:MULTISPECIES: ABC transporter ATP-binding protein [unclassified Bradyrhizobium]MBR1216865.1 ABC transporter ATP-binding protein [Bradyrhizobium sp. U87765 SZCCT0131]MBR1259379.1 ABC transporter ATP-binding protein [Bradyrhizobium sp. U87765 SZCCT0134]MBR1305520.1 ABC transporter ATP-binding protein [Bradyrhizobium sp. U87765 SZCCT0110]MBR1321887.1 ABC transporter ATP-binding protein [Bradyrhizobium sp. U87765 SZCCT0109]MBR1350835.1 ABC transporter ATP-binding protein [Bradyrhizobium sp. U87